MPNATDILQFGPFVALVFALLYGAYVLIPKALAMHETAVTKIAADSAAAVARLTEDHKQVVQQLTAAFRAELKEQRDWHETLMQSADKGKP